MKRSNWWLPILLLLVAITACGEKEETKQEKNKDVSLEALQVELHVPDSMTQGEEVDFKAKVTQGDEQVEDADEVMFEIWKEGSKEESIMKEAKHDGKGIYAIEYTFEEDGVYYVQSHVTARDMHTMPQKKVVVSN